MPIIVLSCSHPAKSYSVNLRNKTISSSPPLRLQGRFTFRASQALNTSLKTDYQNLNGGCALLPGIQTLTLKMTVLGDRSFRKKSDHSMVPLSLWSITFKGGSGELSHPLPTKKILEVRWLSPELILMDSDVSDPRWEVCLLFYEADSVWHFAIPAQTKTTVLQWRLSTCWKFLGKGFCAATKKTGLPQHAKFLPLWKA